MVRIVFRHLFFTIFVLVLACIAPVSAADITISLTDGHHPKHLTGENR